METPVHVLPHNDRGGEDNVTTIRPSLGASIIFAVMGIVILLPGIDAVWLGQSQGVVFILVGSAITVVPLSRYQAADYLFATCRIEALRVRASALQAGASSGSIPCRGCMMAV